MSRQFLSCHLRLWSELSLEELGALVSRAVLGGIPLGGREDFIRDEVPAVYSEVGVLGAQVVLMGEPDEEGYVLEMNPVVSLAGWTPDQITAAKTDIAPLIRSLLGDDPRVRFTDAGSRDGEAEGV